MRNFDARSAVCCRRCARRVKPRSSSRHCASARPYTRRAPKTTLAIWLGSRSWSQCTSGLRRRSNSRPLNTYSPPMSLQHWSGSQPIYSRPPVALMGQTARSGVLPEVRLVPAHRGRRRPGVERRHPAARVGLAAPAAVTRPLSHREQDQDAPAGPGRPSKTSGEQGRPGVFVQDVALRSGDQVPRQTLLTVLDERLLSAHPVAR